MNIETCYAIFFGLLRNEIGVVRPRNILAWCWPFAQMITFLLVSEQKQNQTVFHWKCTHVRPTKHKDGLRLYKTVSNYLIPSFRRTNGLRPSYIILINLCVSWGKFCPCVPSQSSSSDVSPTPQSYSPSHRYFFIMQRMLLHLNSCKSVQL